MSDERKASADLKEGLGLLFRAARTAAKQIDVAKIDKGLDRAISHVSRAVTTVGRVVGQEINRVAASPPPWASRDKETKPEAESTQEGEVHASGPEAKPGEEVKDKPPSGC